MKAIGSRPCSWWWGESASLCGNDLTGAAGNTLSLLLSTPAIWCHWNRARQRNWESKGECWCEGAEQRDAMWDSSWVSTVCVYLRMHECGEMTKFSLLAPAIQSIITLSLSAKLPLIPHPAPHQHPSIPQTHSSVLLESAWGGGGAWRGMGRGTSWCSEAFESSTPVDVRTVCNLIFFALCVSLFFGAGYEQIEHCV